MPFINTVHRGMPFITSGICYTYFTYFYYLGNAPTSYTSGTYCTYGEWQVFYPACNVIIWSVALGGIYYVEPVCRDNNNNNNATSLRNFFSFLSSFSFLFAFAAGGLGFEFACSSPVGGMLLGVSVLLLLSLLTPKSVPPISVLVSGGYY